MILGFQAKWPSHVVQVQAKGIITQVSSWNFINGNLLEPRPPTVESDDRKHLIPSALVRWSWLLLSLYLNTLLEGGASGYYRICRAGFDSSFFLGLRAASRPCKTGGSPRNTRISLFWGFFRVYSGFTLGIPTAGWHEAGLKCQTTVMVLRTMNQ